jgi:hypothetical protein
MGNDMNRIPCYTDSDENRFDSDDGEELAAPVWIDRSVQYKSAVETDSGISVSGLCRIWDNWRNSGELVWILHGYLMLTQLPYYNAVWREIDFLQDMLRFENE